MLRNLRDLEFDLSMPFKIIFDSVTGLPIYGFLLMFHSSILPNSIPLRDMNFQNLSDLDIGLSR